MTPKIRWIIAVVVIVMIFLLCIVLMIVYNRCKKKPRITKCDDHFRPRVVDTIPVGVTPAGMAVGGHFLYVANNNNYGIVNGDSVTVIDIHKQTVVTTIHDASFNQPYTVTIHGCKGYVTNSNSSTVTVFDTRTNRVTNVIAGFDGPSGMAISCDGKFAYVNNYGGPTGVGSGNGTTVRIVILPSELIGASITVGLAPAALALSKDEKFLYVLNYVDGNTGTGTMSVVRTYDNVVVNTVTGFSGPFGLVITSRFVYVTNFGSNNFAPIGTSVSVVCRSSNQIVKTIQVGLQPSGIVIAPDERFALVSNYNTLYAGSNFTSLTSGQGTVDIIKIRGKKRDRRKDCKDDEDHDKNTVIAPTLLVGQAPSAIVISADGRFAFVSNFTSNTITIVALK